MVDYGDGDGEVEGMRWVGKGEGVGCDDVVGCCIRVWASAVGRGRD